MSSSSSGQFSADELARQAQEGWGEGYTLPYNRTDGGMTTLMHWTVAVACFGLGLLALRGIDGGLSVSDIPLLTWVLLFLQCVVAGVATYLAWRAVRQRHSYTKQITGTKQVPGCSRSVPWSAPL